MNSVVIPMVCPKRYSTSALSDCPSDSTMWSMWLMASADQGEGTNHAPSPVLQIKSKNATIKIKKRSVITRVVKRKYD